MIRNFAIIAHIDHGKSTLADRLIDFCDTINIRDKKNQILDSMSLEQERGITIKLNTIQLEYKAKDNKTYILNLIDTPGHVDFTYEVSRSLAACEGVILLVDATQGIEAQTLANYYLAKDNNLVIIPIINKIDLPNANPDKVEKEILEIFDVGMNKIPKISAKEGNNIQEVLESIVEKIPAPNGKINNPLQVLIFDSYYDKYRGVILYIKVVEGKINKNDKLMIFSSKKIIDVNEIGIKKLNEESKESLIAGEVGWISTGIKDSSIIHVGDTLTTEKTPALEPLPGYKKLTPMVFCGLYPLDNKKINELKTALEKLKISDSSLIFQPESSIALGNGFRCGFLGLLHLEITQERIEREFNIEVIPTAPSTVYKIVLNNNDEIIVDNPSNIPNRNYIKEIYEPYVLMKISTPEEYIGNIMELCQQKRGVYIDIEYKNDNRLILLYELPLSEILYDFFNKLKSYSRGYASFEYDLSDYRKSSLEKLEILINGKVIDAFSMIVHKDFLYNRGNQLIEKLKKVLPRQQFEIPIQAAVSSKIIARTNVKALRKNVLAKCYGGDISRKKKLLEKQKEGKKKMKLIGNVLIPQEAFFSILTVDDD